MMQPSLVSPGCHDERAPITGGVKPHASRETTYSSTDVTWIGGYANGRPARLPLSSSCHWSTVN